MHGALRNVRVIDLSANAPGPFASKMLADMGAEVICIANPVGPPSYAAVEDPVLSGRDGPHDALARRKSRLALDLKTDAGRAEFLDLVESADVVISEMRPGKLDALGLGWNVLAPLNPGLILCEITGYGAEGPMARRAGHDLNYLAVSGALSLIRDENGKPVPPQNIVGDYAAGGLLAASSILAALLDGARTGRGQHLIVSITDGIRYLMADIAAATVLAGHEETEWRGTLGGAMPTYETYKTADGAWLAVAALEPKFIDALGRGLEWQDLPELMAAKSRWPEARAGLTERFRSRTLAEWDAVFADTDACVTPVSGLRAGRADQLGRLDLAVGRAD